LFNQQRVDIADRRRGAMVSRACMLACLIVILDGSISRADDVQLANGDRISGRIVSLLNSVLLLQTAHGELRISWPLITGVMVVDPIFVTVITRAPAAVTISPGGADGRVILSPGGVVPIKDILAMSRPKPPLLSLDGRLNAGIIASGGNTSANSLRFGGEMVGRMAANRFTGGASFNRGREHDVETAHNWTTSFRYDRFVTRRLFIDGNTILSADRLRDLDLRTAVGTGLGYQVVDRRRLQITMDGGVGYVRERSRVGPDDRYTAAQESGKVDFFVNGNRFQLFHRHEGYFGLAGDDNRFVKTQNGVRVPIRRGIITTAQLDVDYDPTPVPGGQSIDRTFALNFGYQF
jgi:putative salt-induced outer membrane protein YdiY